MLYLAIVIIGVGIQRLVEAATHEAIPPSDIAMWLFGTILLGASMTTIAATMPRVRRPGLAERAERLASRLGVV